MLTVEQLRKERNGFAKSIKPLFPLISQENKFFKSFITDNLFEKPKGVHLNIPFQSRFKGRAVRATIMPDLWDEILDKYPRTTYIDVLNLTKEIGLVSVCDWSKRHSFNVAVLFTDIGWSMKDRIYAS